MSLSPSRLTSRNIDWSLNLYAPTYLSRAADGSLIATRSPGLAAPAGWLAVSAVLTLGGLTWAASAVRVNDIPASAAMPTRRHLTGLLSMILILSSRNDLDSDIAATAPT